MRIGSGTQRLPFTIGIGVGVGARLSGPSARLSGFTAGIFPRIVQMTFISPGGDLSFRWLAPLFLMSLK
jgi:hypothetical protein